MNTEKETKDINFITIHGGTVLLYKKYKHHKKKEYKNGTSAWRCSTYKKTKCPGSLTIDKVRLHLVIKKVEICLALEPLFSYGGTVWKINLAMSVNSENNLKILFLFFLGKKCRIEKY